MRNFHSSRCVPGLLVMAMAAALMWPGPVVGQQDDAPDPPAKEALEKAARAAKQAAEKAAEKMKAAEKKAAEKKAAEKGVVVVEGGEMKVELLGGRGRVQLRVNGRAVAGNAVPLRRPVQRDTDDESKPSKPESVIDLEESPAVVELVKEAERLRSEKRLTESASVYQQILDQYPYKVMQRGDDYLDASLWVQQELMSDRKFLDIYRRVHDPGAQRALAQSQGLADPVAGLSDVVRRYLLCPTGLEAALQLAGCYLEQGNPIDAANVLDRLAEHPDLQTQAARWHELQAAAGLFAQRPRRYETHRAGLENLKEGERLERLAAWARNLSVPATTRRWLDPDRRQQADIPSKLGPSLWNPGVLATPFMPQPKPNQTTRTVSSSSSMRGHLYPVKPALDEQRLYINDNTAIIAYDRISGEPLARYQPPVDAAADASLRARYQRYGTKVPTQLRGVEIASDDVYGVVGMASDNPGVIFGHMPQVRDTFLVCLNRLTLAERWRTTPAQLHESLDRTYFHGTPALGPGRVFALLRRGRNGWFESFLVAVDRASGKLLWHRYVAGTPAVRNGRALPFAEMTVHGDRLYVVDNLGTVSCRDGRTGEVLWISVAPSQGGFGNVSYTTSRTASAAVTWAPVVLPAGLVVKGHTHAQPVLLDLKTGKTLDQFKAGPVKDATYLLQCGDDLVCVGRTAALVDGRTLKVKWQQKVDGYPSTGQGAPAVSRDAVWIPAGNRLKVYGLAKGELKLDGTLSQPGNIVTQGPQIVVAGSKTIQTYMEWDVAKAALLKQIAAHPTDPTRGMSLAQLALTTKHYESIVPGVDFATTAIDSHRQKFADKTEQQTKMQDDVFRMLRRFVEPKAVADVKLRRELFDRMSSVTSTSWQQVQYLLDHGAYLDEIGQKIEAVRGYQAILDSPALASEFFEHKEQGTRPAGSESRYRLRKLVDKDPSLYDEFERKAAARLAQLKGTPNVDPDALVKLARRYPFAQSAARARLAAAEVFVATGDTSAAVTQLRQGYLELHDDDLEVAQELLSRWVLLLEKAGKPRLAGHWLKKAAARFDQLALLREGQPITVEQWQQDLAGLSPSVMDLPAFDLPVGKPMTLVGRLMAPTHQSPREWPRDAVLTRHGNRLQYRNGAKLDVAWEAPLNDLKAQVMALTQEQVILWHPSTAQLSVLDTRSGKSDWEQSIQLREQFQRLEGAVENNQKTRDQMMAELKELPPAEQVRRMALMELLEAQNRKVQAKQIVVQGGIMRINNGRAVTATGTIQLTVTETAIIAVDPLGRLVAIDRYAGRVLWSQRLPLTRITNLVANEDIVTVSGQANADPRNIQPRVIVLDAENGERRLEPIDVPGRAAINWLGVGGPGFILCVNNKLIAYSADTGQPEWDFDVAPGKVIGPKRFDTDLIMLTDASGSLLPIDAMTGKLMAKRIAVTEGPPAGSRLQFVDQMWHVLTPEQVTALNGEGSLMWRDAVATTPKNFVQQLIGSDYVIVVAAADEQRVVFPRVGQLNLRNTGRNAYRVYLIERITGRLYDKIEIERIPEPLLADQSVLLDKRIVLSTANRIIVIPAANAP